MPVNLLAPLGERYGASALATALRTAQTLGFSLTRIDAPDDRLCAWIDWQFAPSWWSSETRTGSAWYAHTAAGAIAGFAAFGSSDRSAQWLRAYRQRSDVGVFGPFGVAHAYRKTGLGENLLTAALCGLAESVPSALIPAVHGGRLVTSYRQRTAAEVVETYELVLRPARVVIMASGTGTNAQAVIDDVLTGNTALTIAAIVTNDAAAQVRARARNAGLAQEAVVWDRAHESRSAYDARLIDVVGRYRPDLILLLGWMHLLPTAFLEQFPETLNVHPAFLPFDAAADVVAMPDGTTIPAFRGARSPEATIAAGAAWGGASVHRVTPQTDRGEILVRTPVELGPGTTLAQFRERVQPLEHAAVIKALRRWSLSG